jgi:thiol-disulfide isomerase/thioredoxin
LKKYFLFIVLCSVLSACHSQPQDATANTLKTIQQIPAFTIMSAPDSIAFTSEQLQKNKPVVLVFFNPDCDHCQKETKELLAYKNELKDIQIVMSSVLPYKLINEFYKDYNIASMPNIKMGQDVNYALGKKYRPARFPGIYIYDASGSLAKVFAGNAGVPAILDAVK